MPSTSAWWVFDEQREAVAALEPLDEPDLPERLVAVELLGEHAARQRAELLLAAGRRAARCGGRGSARLRCGSSTHLGRPCAERHERELLAVARHQVQAALDRLDELVVGPGGRRRRACTAATCMCAAVVLQVEERRVESRQAVVRHGVPSRGGQLLHLRRACTPTSSLRPWFEAAGRSFRDVRAVRRPHAHRLERPRRLQLLHGRGADRVARARSARARRRLPDARAGRLPARPTTA